MCGRLQPHVWEAATPRVGGSTIGAQPVALRVQVVEALTALAESAPDVPMGRAHHADTPRFVLSRAFDEPNVTYQGSLTPPTLGLALTLALTLTSALTLALTLTTDPSPDQAR